LPVDKQNRLFKSENKRKIRVDFTISEQLDVVVEVVVTTIVVKVVVGVVVTMVVVKVVVLVVKISSILVVMLRRMSV
jgi:uncharacterized membrane protein